jgi:hypothetical protein
VTGSLRSLLRDQAQHLDLLLWDLADERLGVYRSPDGCYLTRSVEAVRSGVVAQFTDAWEFIPFGSDEHFALWAAALPDFTRLRTELAAGALTILLDVPWAAHDANGGATPASFGVSADQANRRYRRYIEAARSQPGITVVTVDEAITLGDPEHRWGLAPFHYAPPVYQALVSEIETLARPHATQDTLREPDAVPRPLDAKAGGDRAPRLAAETWPRPE